MGQRCRIEIRTGAIFAGALALLVLPLSFFLSFVIAGSIHEFAHWLVLRWTGVKVYKICVGPFGATMETEPMGPGREVLCALAGPVGSFLLVFGYRVLPEIALCALFQGCFNLLPLYPMDGGRVFRCLLEIMRIPRRDAICGVVELTTALVICAVCWYGFWKWNLGCGVLFWGAVLVLRTFPRKTPCKEAFFGVQ